MAQIGSFVPAKRDALGIVDRIFTRIGAGDDLASGQSTFYMEMAEAATILRRSTRALAAADRRGRARHRNARRAVDRAGDLRVSARSRRASADGALCDALSRAVRARRPLAQRRELSHHGGREHVRVAARRSFRIACSREARRARSASRSRAWRAYRDAVIERAQEIADALSGEADIETRIPLRKKMPKRQPAERQLTLLPPA